MRKEVTLLLKGACWPGTSKYSISVKWSLVRSVTGQPPLLTSTRIWAGCVLPLTAAPAEACAATVRDAAPPAPVFITSLGAAGDCGGGAGLDAGVSKTGFSTGAGSGILTGGTGLDLDGAFVFTATGFFTGAVFFSEATAFLFGTGFFLAGVGFLAEAGCFFAGTFFGAGFLAMVVGGSELFQFPRG